MTSEEFETYSVSIPYGKGKARENAIKLLDWLMYQFPMGKVKTAIGDSTFRFCKNVSIPYGKGKEKKYF